MATIYVRRKDRVRLNPKLKQPSEWHCSGCNEMHSGFREPTPVDGKNYCAKTAWDLLRQNQENSYSQSN